MRKLVTTIKLELYPSKSKLSLQDKCPKCNSIVENVPRFFQQVKSTNLSSNKNTSLILYGYSRIDIQPGDIILIKSKMQYPKKQPIANKSKSISNFAPDSIALNISDIEARLIALSLSKAQTKQPAIPKSSPQLRYHYKESSVPIQVSSYKLMFTRGLNCKEISHANLEFCINKSTHAIVSNKEVESLLECMDALQLDLETTPNIQANSIESIRSKQFKIKCIHIPLLEFLNKL